VAKYWKIYEISILFFLGFSLFFRINLFSLHFPYFAKYVFSSYDSDAPWGIQIKTEISDATR